jgi:hypothetical protein
VAAVFFINSMQDNLLAKRVMACLTASSDPWGFILIDLDFGPNIDRLSPAILAKRSSPSCWDLPPPKNRAPF